MNALKRIISSLLAVLMTISVMIKDGKSGKVELVVTGEVTTESEKIELEVKSYSLKKIDYDTRYTIEVKKDGEWKKLESAPTEDIALVASPMFLQSRNVSVDIRNLPDGKLEAGEYRVTKMIKIGTKGEWKPYTAYFTVAEAPAQESVTAAAA